MKTQIIEKSDLNNIKAFPKLMKTKKNTVVLFSAPECGVVLTTIFDYPNVGQYDEDWCMSEFEDFDGKIILENS